MSLASQQNRRSNAQTAISNMMRKLKRCSEADVTLTDDQHEEICSIVCEISDEELEKVFLEGSEHGVSELMKEVWYTDSKRQQQQYLHDQSSNGEFDLSMICTLCLQHVLFLQFVEHGATGGA